MSRIYKVRKAQTGTSNKTGEPFIQYSVALPTNLAEKIIEEHGEDSLAFEIELTAKGILYKLVQANDLDLDGELPFAPQKATGKARAPRKPAAAKKAPAKKAAPKTRAAAKPKAKAAPKPKAAPKAKAKPKAKVTPKAPRRKAAA